MALDKAIKYGKEHRKPYTGSKAFFCSCRNHGTCSWCKRNRLHKFRDKHSQTLDEAVDDMTEVLEVGCPECGNHLFKLFAFETHVNTYKCAYCGHYLEVWD